MPSGAHEVLIELFRQRPALAAELLTDALGVQLPEYQGARVAPSELTDLRPTEYRADAVVVLTRNDGSARTDVPVLAVVVEAQLRRDIDKRYSWPVYVTTLCARLRCPVTLLVLCPNPAVAQWCAAPIPVGHPSLGTIRPLVAAPERIPVVTDPQEALACPELTVLSAMAHGGRQEHVKVLHALATGLQAVGGDVLHRYIDLVYAALPAAARKVLEGQMTTGTYEYQSDFALRYFRDGEARGEAKGVLAVLAARGIEVPDDARTRILTTTDLDQVSAWLQQAGTVDTVDDLFADR